MFSFVIFFLASIEDLSSFLLAGSNPLFKVNPKTSNPIKSVTSLPSLFTTISMSSTKAFCWSSSFAKLPASLNSFLILLGISGERSIFAPYNIALISFSSVFWYKSYIVFINLESRFFMSLSYLSAILPSSKTSAIPSLSITSKSFSTTFPFKSEVKLNFKPGSLSKTASISALRLTGIFISSVTDGAASLTKFSAITPTRPAFLFWVKNCLALSNVTGILSDILGPDLILVFLGNKPSVTA